jgi:tetrahydromethanopterin S-methyltransferase subunit G
MPGQADEELLATVQAMAATLEHMLRRQLATEQVFRELRDKVEPAQRVSDKANANAAEIKLLHYKIDELTKRDERQVKENEQIFAVLRSLSGRILILYIAIGILLTVLLISIGISLFR